MAKVRRLNIPTEDRSIDHLHDLWLGAGNSSLSSAGKLITDHTAMGVAPVFGCVRLIAGVIGSLPMGTFTTDNEIKLPYRPTPEWMSFNRGPWNRTTVLETGIASAALSGNTYYATHRNNSGTILHVTPLDPNKVEPVEAATDNNMEYRVTTSEGITVGGPMDILHIPGIMLPGDIKGVSVVTAARETFGKSLAIDEYGANLLKNDARPPMGLEVPGELTQTSVDLMRESWDRVHRGSGNSGKLAVMTEGATFRNLAINPDDAQYVQTLQQQTPQVCMFFGVHPARLGYTDAALLGSSLSEINTMFAQDTLAPWANRFSDGFSDAQRYSGDTPDDVQVSLSLSAYTRGEYVTRMSTNVQAIREGLFTINEVRQTEGYGPVPWGDEPQSVQVQPYEGDQP